MKNQARKHKARHVAENSVGAREASHATNHIASLVTVDHADQMVNASEQIGSSASDPSHVSAQQQRVVARFHG